MPDERRYSIFLPGSVAYDITRVLQLLSVTCGRDDSYTASDSPASSTTMPTCAAGGSEDGTGGPGYLVLVRTGKCKDSEDDSDLVVWHGQEVKIDLTGDTAIAVSHMEVVSRAVHHHHHHQSEIYSAPITR